MKNKIFLIIVFLFSVVSLKANTVDSLLVVLDKAILDSHKYVEVREKRIKELKKFGSNLSNARKKYANNMLLYKEYRTFICDSAISYLNKKAKLACKFSLLYCFVSFKIGTRTIHTSLFEINCRYLFCLSS